MGLDSLAVIEGSAVLFAALLWICGSFLFNHTFDVFFLLAHAVRLSRPEYCDW
jgi:hypothetical protein